MTKTKAFLLIISAVLFLAVQAKAQVEHVPITHPVYSFLLRAESKGLLEHFSLSALPLQRKEIVTALETIGKDKTLSEAELSTLMKFETEFEIRNRKNAVVIYSASDSNQVLSGRMFSDDEKFIYRYKTDKYNVNFSALGSIESITQLTDEGNRNVQTANLGIRMFGTLTDHFGYYISATNGVIAGGETLLALEEIRNLRQNVKFADLGSDFDFSESHVRFDYDWFYAVVGRESKLIGAGINHRMFASDNSPPSDAISVGAKFKTFEYRFTHAGLLAVDRDTLNVGFNAYIPTKYLVTHRFAVRPAWGEIAFWEGIVYTKRPVDFAYLNPLSFFKSLEHALHDRDNSMMGLDATIRPFDGLQLKGSFFLDDIKIDEIGTGYWSNKTAWNIGAIYALPFNTDIAVEYARVEPYTFTHFDSLNAMTNDELLVGSYLLPNSDEISVSANIWTGWRYPIKMKFSYSRHGENYYDEDGNYVNVGGDPSKVMMIERDSYRVTFLDGIRNDVYRFQLSAGKELARGFNLQAMYLFRSTNEIITHGFRVKLAFEDF